MQVNSINNVSFGHRVVNIDPRILKQATKEELSAINLIKHNLKNNRIEKDLKFEAVVDSANNIVNVTQLEDKMHCESMYSKNQPFKMQKFIDVWKRQEQVHEERYYKNRVIEDAFGDQPIQF